MFTGQADDPPASDYVDVHSETLGMTPRKDGDIYRHLHQPIQQEAVLDRGLAFMGLLARIGIPRGGPCASGARLQAMFDKAAPEALQDAIITSIMNYGTATLWTWQRR